MTKNAGFAAFQASVNHFCQHARQTLRNKKSAGLLTSDALFCAEDTIRNQKFWEAIQAAIQAIKNSPLTPLTEGGNPPQ